jgi:hypothetical protein
LSSLSVSRRFEPRVDDGGQIPDENPKRRPTFAQQKGGVDLRQHHPPQIGAGDIAKCAVQFIETRQAVGNLAVQDHRDAE